jgi:hypothetical protein
MVPSFRFLRCVDSAIAGLQETKNLVGESPPPDSDPFDVRSCTKTVRIGSSQAPPNFYVGFRLTSTLLAP